MKTLDLQSLDSIKSKKIYFYGLSVIAEYVKKGTEYHNLKIEGVFDTTINKQNINVKNNFGLNIISQENLFNLKKDSIFLITCSHYFSVERLRFFCCSLKSVCNKVSFCRKVLIVFNTSQ